MHVSIVGNSDQNYVHILYQMLAEYDIAPFLIFIGKLTKKFPSIQLSYLQLRH